MARYRLYYFRGNRLEQWQEFDADTFVSAVQMGAQRAGNDLAELWSDQGRIATFRPRRRHPEMDV